MQDVTGLVLAGGQSRRMGQDKALLEVRGRTLLESALAVARAVAPLVRIVGPRERYGGFAEVVEDVFPGQGPLAGIHAGLRSSPTDLNLVLAVDTPLVTPAFLRYLLQRAEESGAVVTVPRAGRGLHPLCAVYRREFAEAAETALAAGKNKVDAVFAQVRSRVVDEDEIRAAGFEPGMLRNLNSPEDVAGL